MIGGLATLLRRLAKARQGTVVLVMALATTATLGTAAVVVDLGTAELAQRQLQAATDAAALAGANDINTGSGKAVATAIAYSAMNSGKNASSRLTNVTMPAGYPQLTCLANTGMTTLCTTGSDKANAIVVKQTATVKTYFAKLIGFSSMTVNASATAAVSVGQPKQLDVMIILDNTGSMHTDPDNSCGYNRPGKGVTTYRIDCALAGARTLIAQLDPAVDNIGLMIFPGTTTTAEAAKATSCTGAVPAVQSYASSPIYEMVALGPYSYAFDTKSNAPTKAGLANALQDGTTADPNNNNKTCQQGLQAPGGVQTFFADAIDAAQNALLTEAGGRKGAQKVIIILSDGESNSSYAPSKPIDKTKNQCRQGVTAAQTATAAGTWVYSIAYGAPTAYSCPTDTPSLTPCETMRQMATDASRFYSDGNNGCVSAANPVYKLTDIFASISKTASAAVSGPVLVADSTT